MRLPSNKFNPFGNRGSQRQFVDQAEIDAKKRLMLMLLANSILILTVYFILNRMQFWPIFFIYMGIAAVLVLIYVIYNRGFVGKNTTPDMLPDTMTLAEKQAFLQDAKNRLHRSRWALTLLIPIVLTFAADFIYIYLFPQLREMFL